MSGTSFFPTSRSEKSKGIIMMESFGANDKILSYNDVVLRGSDLDILRGPNFINDRLIEFYFGYMASSYSSTDILLVSPSISFWIMHCQDIQSIKDVVEPLDLLSKKIVLFTVNDNEDFTMPEGGVHWSLLVFNCQKKKFVHHDSLGGQNLFAASKLTRGLERYLRTIDPNFEVNLVEGTTPRQQNGYDCGMYVILIAGVICRWAGGGSCVDGGWLPAVINEVTPESVSSTRKRLLVLIESLMEESALQRNEKSISDRSSVTSCLEA